MNRLPLRIVILAMLLSTLIGCGNGQYSVLDDPSSQAVVETSGYPSVVEVVLPSGTGFCSGTFISTKAVLTAAHCALGPGIYTINASFGTFETETRTVFGAGTVGDPDDIAVLVLNEDAADPAQGEVIGLGGAPQVGTQIRIVGFGCDDLDTEAGAGTKRTGTNQIMAINDFLELLTTPTASMAANHSNKQKVLGPSNQAGSCFGDSGGPMFTTDGESMKLVGATHAGGWASNLVESEYINLNRPEIVAFFHRVDQNYGLNLFTGCWNSDNPDACSPTSANLDIFSFLRGLWMKIIKKLAVYF